MTAPCTAREGQVEEEGSARGTEWNVRSGGCRSGDVAESEEAEADQVEEGRIGFPARLGRQFPARPGKRPGQGERQRQEQVAAPTPEK